MKPICMYIVLSCLCILPASCQQVRMVSVTVIEESGKPIRDADVTVTYLGAFGEDTQRVTGKTDDKGVFVAKGSTVLEIVVQVTKDGYYATTLDDLNRKEDHDLILILREKKNPIPLYAKDIHLRMPVNREWIGYDFQVGDWVGEHGEGKVIDVLFRCDTKMTAPRDAKGTLEIRFPNEGEGLLLVDKEYLITSEMKLPHRAPVKGYEQFYFRKEDSHQNRNALKNVGYFFKARVVRENDEIVSAHYGKIFEDLYFSPRHGNLLVKNPTKPYSYAAVSFTYYFNPTPNDANLEFDPSKNLLKDLEVEERVRKP